MFVTPTPTSMTPGSQFLDVYFQNILAKNDSDAKCSKLAPGYAPDLTGKDSIQIQN